MTTTTTTPRHILIYTHFLVFIYKSICATDETKCIHNQAHTFIAESCRFAPIYDLWQFREIQWISDKTLGDIVLMKNWVDKREISDKTDNLVALVLHVTLSCGKFTQIHSNAVIQNAYECAFWNNLTSVLHLNLCKFSLRIAVAGKYAPFDHSQKYFH